MFVEVAVQSYNSYFWKLISTDMSLEAKKLNLIARFMALEKETSISRVEEILTEIELHARADASDEAIKNGQVRSYDDFSKDVKQWLTSKSIN